MSASVLVSKNVKRFAPNVLDTFSVEVKTSDNFIADTIDLDPLLAVSALARMRSRFQNLELSAGTLLLRYEYSGFI